jgi:hypothetical protein
VAIHAAARVIKGILRDIERHQAGPWARFFIRPGERFDAGAPYAALNPLPSGNERAMQLMRQRNLAEFVVAIYNSDGSILTNTNPNEVSNPRTGHDGSYPNSSINVELNIYRLM